MALIKVNTKQGMVLGTEEKGYSVFKGIPYAKPPIGDLRWRAPQEAEKWEGQYVASTFGSRCMQPLQRDTFYLKEFYDDDTYSVGDSEDCLYLNIWTPANAAEDKLPVAFWIHGGAFIGGHGGEKEFDGEAYCRRNVILVTINYRCNIFGFLAHPELSAESKNGISGNYGILDQVAALKWVNENIATFGGDPDNITVFGQSAGSMSVQTLVSSDLTENMINQAVFQSGGGYDNGLNKDRSLEYAMKLGVEVLRHSNIGTVNALRQLSSGEVLEVSDKAMMLMMPREGLLFTPNIDGYVLKGGYNQLMDENRVKDIPYMMGSTKDDIFVNPEETAAGIKGNLYKGCVQWSLKLEHHTSKPGYVYYFSRDLPGDDAGAFHSSELWYMFGTMKRCWRQWESHDYELSELMMDYWTRFMKSGNPNELGIETWQPCTGNNPFVMEFK